MCDSPQRITCARRHAQQLSTFQQRSQLPPVRVAMCNSSHRYHVREAPFAAVIHVSTTITIAACASCHVQQLTPLPPARDTMCSSYHRYSIYRNCFLHEWPCGAAHIVTTCTRRHVRGQGRPGEAGKGHGEAKASQEWSYGSKRSKGKARVQRKLTASCTLFERCIDYRSNTYVFQSMRQWRLRQR